MHRIAAISSISIGWQSMRLLACCSLTLVVSSGTLAQIPSLISLQGNLADVASQSIDSAGLSLQFQLYDGDSPIWSETHSVDVHNGLFDVILGEASDLDTIAFDRGYWLGVTVGGESSEISPRSMLTSSPYALSFASDTSKVPRIITHQGLIVDSSGIPVPDDSLTIHFALYSDPDGPTPDWTETQTVWTISGRYAAYLGSKDSLNIPFDRPYWLGITIDGQTEMVPRTPLTAVPYALNPPPNESCDGLDNDFDGKADEDFLDLGESCTVGIGACANTGSFVCSADGLSTECDAAPGAPSPEVCDGLDNDCDASIDEEFPLGEICSVGIGACTAIGHVVCGEEGGQSTSCDAVEGTPSPESCDGLDNDCDGSTDEDILGPACGLQLGVCDGTTEACVFGTSTCYSDDGTVRISTYGPLYRLEEDPTMEPGLCDGHDNDCDGSADEGCGVCPAGMVLIEDFCIDRWEAYIMGHSPYAIPTGGVAASAQGVVPQGYVSGQVAEAACVEAGKRLCTSSEWLRACQGPSGTTYPYGNTYDSTACNEGRPVHPVTEVFGPDATWSSEELNDPQLNQLANSLDPAGSNLACVSAESVYDLHGNLNEWISDASGIWRGGYYVDATNNGAGCSYVTTAHSTSYHDFSTGFRCCMDAP